MSTRPKWILVISLLCLIIDSRTKGLTEIVSNGDGTYILENNSVKAVINVSNATQMETIGGITHLYDKMAEISSDLVGSTGILFGARAGNFYPAPGTATIVEDNGICFETLSFVNTSGATMPLNATITYKLIDNRISVSFDFETEGQFECIDGLDITYKTNMWTKVRSHNHCGSDEEIFFRQAGKIYYHALNQLYEFENDGQRLGIVSRNPYWSMVRIEDAREGCQQFDLRVLIACGPWKAKEPRGPKLASVLSPGDRLKREYEIVVLQTNGTIIEDFNLLAYFSPYPAGHEQIITMTFDDIPFKRWVFPTSATDVETPVQGMLVRLLEDHPEMKMGWVVVPDPITRETDLANPEYPPGEWWNAHSVHRILTSAPQTYRDWLVQLERNIIVYGYEDRVALGSHGYHHAPEMEFGPNWEFQYQDPIGHDKTFDAVCHEFVELGLTAKSLKWIRFPGFWFTRSTVDALIRHEFILFDYWGVYDKPPMVLFYSEFGRIWGLGTIWEGDTPSPYDLMKDLLSRGKICHTAGHPSKWFDDGDEEAYGEISEVFDRAEVDFPHLGYMFPDSVGFFADEMYELTHIDQRMTEDELILSFTGRTTQKQTVVVSAAPDYSVSDTPSIDGILVPCFEERGSNYYVVLPELQHGKHELVVPFTTASNRIEDIQYVDTFFSSQPVQNYPNPFNRRTKLIYSLAKPGRVTMSIYNVLGHEIMRLVEEYKDRGIYEVYWNGENPDGSSVDSGIYFCTFDIGPFRDVKKLVYLK